MRRHVLIILALLPAVALPAAAAEFIPSWDVDGVWDSNVLRTETDEESDFSLRTGPDLRFREKQGNFTYDATYQLRYQEYVRLNGISEFDQFANGEASWRVTPTTDVGFSDDFGYSASLGGIFDFVGVGTAIQIVTPKRQRITTNTANANVRQRLGPLWELTFSVNNDFTGFRAENQPDSLSTSGTIQATRGITRRLIAGVGGRYQRQDFSDTQDRAGQGSTVYQGFGILNYRISPTWRFAMSAGPALAEPDPLPNQAIQASSYFPVAADTCPTRSDGIHFVPQGQALGFTITGPRCQPALFRAPNGTLLLALPTSRTEPVPFSAQGGSLTSLNYFGRISLDKDWEHWTGSVSYSRSASSGSGLGTSTAVDTFEGTVRWTPSPWWNVSLLAVYSTQTQLTAQRALQFAVRSEQSEVLVQAQNGAIGTISAPIAVPFEVSQGDAIDNAFTATTTRVELFGMRRLSRRLSIDGTATWWQQATSSDFAEGTSIQDYRVVLGFTWNFEPIPL
jgi:hypothetical protein